MIEFLKHLGEHVGVWLYVLAGGLAFGEAAILIGLVLPGETALLVAGFFCHEGVLDLRIMIPVAVLCAILGDSVGYEFGRWFGPRLKTTRLGRFVGEPRWDKAEGFLRRHGGKAVLLGRSVAVLRALTPSMAGMARMRYRVFLPWNAAGGLIWGAGCVLLGYAFAGALSTVETYLTWAPIVVLVALIAFFVYREVTKRRRERAERDGQARSAEPAPATDRTEPAEQAVSTPEKH